MTQTLTIIKLVLSLLPAILEAIRAIEAAFPQSGQGASKLALMREAISAAYQIGSDVTVQFEQVWPAIEKTIGASVKVFNATGAFQKGQ